MRLALRGMLLVGLLVASGALRARAEALDEALYAGLLERHTRSVPATVGTQVDYSALRGSAGWRELVADLSRVDPAALAGRPQELAFWINAYNILAIDLIVRHPRVASIRDIGSLLRPVWEREAGRIGGEPYSLGRIEHRILRPMGDPRIHVAIVCASTSCPSLRRQPFTAAQIDSELDESARRFLASPTKGMRLEPGAVRVSRILDWFEEDFEPSGGVPAFLRRHAPAALRPSLGEDLRIRYLDYDWTLNAWDGS